ncbi:hypothetical protein GVN16_00900 [Emticicia sp. CRIBPO]|uniref:DUF6728 family protein n=1 Tax=Emticicia sp. CRIBPO TaxID=2683258 RepID=UPI00141335ED|nr:DUF6728 family protein [Emticicia sp. CRIBPO]NBA84296.1 hypothetical protein [Emticicia sp. CRIBPO]
MEKFLSYLKIAPVFSYFLRVFKKDTEGKYPVSTNLKLMHGINRISIIMFLVCIIVLIVRAFTR